MKSDLTDRRLAVVVVDMQWLFISPDSPFPSPLSGKLVEAVNTVTALGRRAGWPIIHSRYVFADGHADAGLLAGAPFVQAGHLDRSAHEARLDPRIVVDPGDRYSEHPRPSAFFRSNLEALLAEVGAEALVLAGVSTNNAVGATAREAFALDIPVLIPREAVAVAPDEPHGEIHLAALDRWTADVRTTAEIAELANCAASTPQRGA